VTESNLLADGEEEILDSVLATVDGDLYVVSPSGELVEALVSVAADAEERPTIRLLADESVLKSVMEDFVVASTVADLVEMEDLSIRTLDDDADDNALVITPTAVLSIVSAGDRVAALSTDDASFVDTARDSYEARFEAAPAFGFRTPPLSRVRGTLADEIGEAARDDFDAALDSLDGIDGAGLDEVTVSLLVAARNEVLLYDISKWGEDVGIASKATFSRTKTRLEDRGLIATEKVPIDVGRPRLRLKLGDDRLREASADELVDVARSLLD